MKILDKGNLVLLSHLDINNCFIALRLQKNKIQHKYQS